MLAIERHSGSPWLVKYDAPGSDTCVLIAKFPSEREARLFTEAWNTALASARAAGASGI